MQDHPARRSQENDIALQKFGIGQPVRRKEDDTLVRDKFRHVKARRPQAE
jgi:carbon-monoxide dehydrogenase large subunit